MPIYAYKCEACGHAQDVLRKISDPPLGLCPQCGAAAFVKQVTAAGFQLKGSGWYVTDFRGGNSAKAVEGAKEPGKQGQESASTSAAAPAAAVDTAPKSEPTTVTAASTSPTTGSGAA
jgi:putative FmdB family regulatory protein